MGNYYRRGYHCSGAEWRNRFNKSGAYVGVELELEVQGGYGALLSKLPNFRNKRAPLMEEDGSLTDHNGIELVFPPVQLKNLLRKGSVFTQCIDAAEEIGLRNHARVGMHMNVNTTGWSNLKQQMFLLIVHHLPKTMLETLGGRRLNGYCDQLTLHNTYDHDWALSQVDEEFEDAHSYAAEFKSHRIELRFPASTTDKGRIKQLLSFIQHLSTYAGKIKPAEEYNLPYLANDFLKYLTKSKSGKILLAYMNGETKNNDSTNSVAAPAAPVGWVPSTSSNFTGSIGTIESMLFCTTTVLADR